MAETLIFFDLETGGLNPRRHPICEIAAVAVSATGRERETFEMKVLFDAKTADPKALGINKYDPATWAMAAKPEKEVAEKFAAFCRRHATEDRLSKSGKAYRQARLVAHNADFDGPFLQHWYQKQGLYLPANRKVLCTLQRALWYFAENQQTETPPPDYQLRTLAQYFGVETRPDHTALNDVQATVQVYQAMTRQAPYQMSLTTNQALYLDAISERTGIGQEKLMNRAINLLVSNTGLDDSSHQNQTVGGIND